MTYTHALKKISTTKTLPLCLWLTATLMGCDANNSETDPSLKPQATATDWQPIQWPDSQQLAVMDYRWLGVAGSGLQLQASGSQGLWLRNAQGQALAQTPANIERLDSRALGVDTWLVAGMDSTAQQLNLIRVSLTDTAPLQTQTLPPRPFGLAGICLYQDSTRHSYVFVLGEEGQGEQWLVASGTDLLAQPHLVRHIAMPPQAEYCQVDDQQQLLYVSETNSGVWAYAAGPETETARQPVDMIQPFGKISASVGSLAMINSSLLVMDPAAGEIHAYRPQPDGGEQPSWQHQLLATMPAMKDAEQFVATPSATGITLALRDDDNGRWYQQALNWPMPPLPSQESLPSVTALVETDPVGRHGDAADDPAIWIHPTDGAKSLILGTNKKVGLQVYDLQGHLRQSLDIGRLNNVDIRSGWLVEGQPLSIAAASHRDHNSISLFIIDGEQRTLSHAGEVATSLNEIYGLCLYQPAADQLYAFANSKDGRVIQYRLYATPTANAEQPWQFRGEEVRTVQMASQPEGCVADDHAKRLFIGEEDVGVWTLGAAADAPTELQPVLAVGDVLKDDVEGLGLYVDVSTGETWLVISSQGNDSYVVVNAQAPYTLRGAFQVGLNPTLGIDGTSETDGLEVTSANLGGPWGRGMLVVQDGRNRMPEATQNFKLVPWSDIERLLIKE